MLCGVIRCVWYYGVGECRFSVDGCFPVGGGFLDGYVKTVIVLFSSNSAVNCRFRCNVLKSPKMAWMLE